MCRAKRQKGSVHDLENNIGQMENFLEQQCRPAEKLHLTFEVSGTSPDPLLPVVNPPNATSGYLIKRFRKNKRYCAYFGLTPRLDESGSNRRLGHISKQGPSVVRWLIVEAAWRVIKKSPSLRAFYERVVGGQKQRRKIAIIAVARKLLTIIRAMLTTGELFNEQLISKYCYLQ